MLSDHDNLLSTFGKDSESSNRKNKQTDHGVKSKRITLNYALEHKSRYQHILSQRKTLIMMDKKQQVNTKPKQASKKLKTESDIEVLNKRIRKSISGIADTICKSKLKSSITPQCGEFSSSASSIKRLPNAIKSHSYKQLKSFQSRQQRTAIVQKQNINLNNFNFQQSTRQGNKNLKMQDNLKNSTKKKGNFFDSVNQCPIKSSFSIDMNSQCDSMFQSSRKQLKEKQCSRFDLGSNGMGEKYLTKINERQFSKRRENSGDLFNKKHPGVNVSIGREIEETLKKQFKQMKDSNYMELPKFLESKGTTQDKNQKEFLFYQEANEERSPNFNSIEVPLIKAYDVFSVKRNCFQLPEKQPKRFHKLIHAFMNQIELDYDLRHAKHMFSGIEEPFYANKNYRNRSKWERLNEELNNLGLCYSVDTIKKIFLPTEEEIDPFLSVGKPHDELIHSLIYAYETAEIHWQQEVYQKWQHWDLRDIDLTIENVDRDRKGYITLEDIAAFISVQTGKEYKNRDVVLIYKRLVNGIWNRRQEVGKQTYCSEKEKSRLKFRSLIDCLIRPF